MKMISRFSLLSICFILISNLHAQNKQLTFSDAAYLNKKIRPETLKQLQWMGASDNVTFVYKNKLVKTNAAGLKTDTILSLDDINDKLKGEGIKGSKRFPYVKFVDKTVLHSGIKTNSG